MQNRKEFDDVIIILFSKSGDVTSGRHSIVIFLWKDVDIRSHSQNYFNFELDAVVVVVAWL